MPFAHREGPYALIVCPARELARQTYEFIDVWPWIGTTAPCSHQSGACGEPRAPR